MAVILKRVPLVAALLVAPWSAAGAPPRVTPDAGLTGASSLVYVNRCAGGCTILPGADDAAAGKSSIVSSTRTLSAFAYSDSAFHAVVACLNASLSRYNVSLTTASPGSTPRREIVLAGTPQELGLQAGVAGVSPYTAAPIENVMVFAFANISAGNVDDMCAVAANELAHAYGLDNEYSCPDLTSYLTGCGAKSFTDVDAQCGEYSPRTCGNGSATQNSQLTLGAVIGTDDRVFFAGFDPAGPVLP